jgi:uncharacterized protein (TIGR00369 family)
MALSEIISTAPDFEPEFVSFLKAFFEEKIVFNKVLGLKVMSIKPDLVLGRLNMRTDLVGYYSDSQIHGGVISTCLDAIGGMAVTAAIAGRYIEEPPNARLHRIGKIRTIDMRIDYLRPGIGEWFELRADVVRLGSRVAHTHMEFLGSDSKLLATGSGAYMVS